MPIDISEISRELRKETCPPEVLDKVRRRIASQEYTSRARRTSIAFGVASVVLLLSLGIWRWQVGVQTRQEARRMAAVNLERAQVISQAQNALGLIGCVLLDAEAHSQKIISGQAVPALRNCLEITKNKLTHN